MGSNIVSKKNRISTTPRILQGDVSERNREGIDTRDARHDNLCLLLGGGVVEGHSLGHFEWGAPCHVRYDKVESNTEAVL